MDIIDLQKFATKIRLEALRMIYEGGDGHPGPAFSIADILAVLYGNELRIDPHNPRAENRDRLILSKGHACPALYAALNEMGYFDPYVNHFHLRELGSMFQGHPVMQKTPGIDMTSGSLGNGISIGCGMALAARYNGLDYRTYVLCGDGELQEGVAWEGIMACVKYKLNNLGLFVDANGWQSGGAVSAVGGIESYKERISAFGWNVLEIDGHDYHAILQAIEQMKTCVDKPTAVVAHCVKGKGLPLMENDNSWHKRVPTRAEYETARELLGGKI